MANIYRYAMTEWIEQGAKQNIFCYLSSPQVKAESQETVGKNREHLPPDPPKPGVGEDTPGVDSDHDSDENPTEIQVKETAPKEASGGGLGVKAVVSKLTFPEPRLPYPCFSAISKQEHNKYMHCLLNRSQIPPQVPAIVVSFIIRIVCVLVLKCIHSTPFSLFKSPG